MLIGGGLAALSAVNLMRSLLGCEKLANALTPRDLGKIALLFVALAGVIVLTPYLGLALTGMGFMLAVGLIIRPTLAPAFLVRLLPCAVLFPLFLRLAFGEWLKIPVPTGPFGL
ncbi:tripartite tricarboxylate transporter TctB family protein [Chelativorans sp. M5D2P16]|uniref:tripartite tricarboxylate transporter TctB family protein n=1 Tax=Chelativorans sp. M5D2P16 TaxID=3095678 RepID=UPI002ACA533C|nr:tripartite tricarboxylate transporter TctB family protein [Chelativorans sp. M5D2P16]MDZ5699708.1 hypothetical protein [Chelativorans sp. M5D2P16]